MRQNPLRAAALLQRVIAFAGADLTVITPRALQAAEALVRVLARPPVNLPESRSQKSRLRGSTSPSTPLKPFIDIDELRVVQREINVLLDAVLRRKTTVAEVRLRFGFSSAATSPSNAPMTVHFWLDVDGSLRDRVVYRVVALLTEVGFERLMVCAAPECGRRFLKVTRKEYCSPRCQTRTYMRAFREVSSSRNGESARKKLAAISRRTK